MGCGHVGDAPAATARDRDDNRRVAELRDLDVGAARDESAQRERAGRHATVGGRPRTAEIHRLTAGVWHAVHRPDTAVRPVDGERRSVGVAGASVVATVAFTSVVALAPRHAGAADSLAAVGVLAV